MVRNYREYIWQEGQRTPPRNTGSTQKRDQAADLALTSRNIRLIHNFQMGIWFRSNLTDLVDDDMLLWNQNTSKVEITSSCFLTNRKEE